METKRCTNCHKLLRAETETCSRCGYLFAENEKKQITPVHTGLKRSIPPASPHRAGHYSGLHPEDQPYQSTIMAVQRPPSNTTNVRGTPQPHKKADSMQLSIADHEAETETERYHQMALSQYATLPAVMPPPPVEPPPTLVPALQPQPVRHTPPPPSSYVMPPPPPRKRLLPRGRFVPTILTLSCLLLLVASSLLAFMYINRRPAISTGTQLLNAIPNQLRVNDTFVLSGKGFGINDLINITHDANLPILVSNRTPLQAHTDDTGIFSLQIKIPTTWQVGQHTIFAIDIGKEQSVSIRTTITIEQSSLAPPLLQLAQPSLDLGANAPGVVAKKSIELINAGGRLLTWQASSDQPWLTLSPNNGTFSGRTIAQVTTNSGSLTPQSYAGHITFIQQGYTANPLELTVTMTVKAAPPANLTLSPVTLAYSGTTVQNPTTQIVTLQNTASQPLDWSGAVSTGDGANWLSIFPGNAHLAAHSSATVTVSVRSVQLAAGTYQGTINFKGGTNPAVTVTLSVAAPGYLVASPPSLSFTSVGQSPPAQLVTLQNSGGSPLDWTLTATTVDGANWLQPTPASGHLESGQTGSVAVAINPSGLKPQSYQGTLTFTYGGGLTQTVPISLTVSVPPAPAISLNQGAMSFATMVAINPTPQAFTITNTGNATLNWAISEDQNGTSFAPVSATSGSLAPTKSTTITVSPNLAGVGAGVLATTVTVVDRDTGSKVPSQKLTVTITVKDQPLISLSNSTMSFSHDSIVTESSQLLVITNTGSQILNWTTTPSASWLTADITSGSLDPGASITIDIHCNSSALTPGNYSATFIVSDSDSGTPVIPQTLTVTLTVS